VCIVSVVRFPRVKALGHGFYHCLSRFVDDLFIFGSSDAQCLEAEEFLAQNDISIFNKELKGGCTLSYNRRHRSDGVLCADRFKSVLLEGGRAVTAISASRF
jgi:hypothetical protein